MPSLSPQWEARSFSLPTLSLFSSRRLVRWRRRFLFTHPRRPSPLLRRALHSQRRYNWPKSAAATRSKPSGINVIEPTEICYNNACGGGGGGKSSSFSLLFTLQPLRGSHTQCVTDTNRSWLLSRIVGTFSFIFPVFTIFETDFFSWSPLFASSSPDTFFFVFGLHFFIFHFWRIKKRLSEWPEFSLVLRFFALVMGIFSNLGWTCNTKTSGRITNTWSKIPILVNY